MVCLTENKSIHTHCTNKMETQQLLTTHINNPQSIRERVYYLYECYPQTIEDNKELFLMYDLVFGTTKLKEETVGRYGRMLRQKYPNKFIRSEETRKLNKIQQESCIKEFSAY